VRLLIGLLAAAIVVIAGAAAFVYSGIYDIAATEQHTAPVFWVLKTTMRRAIQHHARDVNVPRLADPTLISKGRTLFVAHCSRCHGAPGVAPEPFALGLRPTPANLANTGIEWPPAQLYWAIKHGMKLTGMPAWEYRLADDDLWAIVAYIQRMPYESPREFHERIAASASPSAPMRPLSSATDDSANRLTTAGGGDARRGRHLLLQYGCDVCHEIPGVVGASMPVGPPLDHMGLHSFIGGVLQNTPGNLVRWIRTPQKVGPDGAMPDLGVTDRDAIDIAAYLESLR
jgi:mono/diheme cytochrome c family protein/cytochrome c2